MLKVAIVGCGKIADGHLEEIGKIGHATVVAACDRELLMAEQLSVRHGIGKYYDDFDRMLAAEKPDIVHITTPPQSHLALAMRAMDAGCHVYVEKPMTLRHADTEALLKKAEELGRKVTIGYEYNFDPPALCMKELVRQGVLGEPVHIESFFGYSLAGAFGAAILGDPRHWVHQLPGPLLHNNIDHLMNKVVELFPDDEIGVHAHALRRRNKTHGDCRDDMQDELRVMFRGRRMTGFGTFSSHIKPTGHFVRLYGTENSIHVDYVTRTVVFDPSATLPSAIGRLLPAFGQAWQYLQEGGRNVLRFARSEYHFFSGLNHLISRYYDSILNGTPLPISHRDMLRVSAMMDEIFAQIRQARALS
jgi:predicted dehydrogenase